MASKLIIVALAALIASASAVPRRRLHQAAGALKNVAILATGGTFTRDASGNLVPITAESLIAAIPGLNTTISVASLKQIALIDSSEATPDFWLNVATNVQSALATADGVIVLHGPDSIQQTAWFLQCIKGIGDSAKPVVLTGSIKAFSDQSPDAPENILAAALAIAAFNSSGVLVSFNGKIFSADYVGRGNANLPQAAIGTSNGGSAVGQVVSGKLQVLRIPAGKNMCPGYPLPTALPKVGVLIAHPGSDGGLVSYLAGAGGASGVVIQALGIGNIAATFSNATVPLLATGFKAVVSRGGTDGFTDPTDGCIGCLGTTIKSGMVHALNLDVYQARIVLALALSQNPNITGPALQTMYNTIAAKN